MCLGIPGQIVSVKDTDRHLAVVDVSGIQRDVNVACVISDERPIEECIGDWVLVHVGFAMSRLTALPLSRKGQGRKTFAHVLRNVA